MYAIFVTIKIKEDRVDEFMTASLGDAQGSVRDEPGCFRFDILQDPQLASRFYLYEVYLDQKAFDAHLEAPHFIKWKSIVSEMFEGDPTRIDMKTIFPSEEGWKQQKPGLLQW